MLNATMMYAVRFDMMDEKSREAFGEFSALVEKYGLPVDTISTTFDASDKADKADKPSNKKADKAATPSKKKADKSEKEYKAPEDHKLLISAGYKKGLVTLSVSDNEGGVYAFLPSDIRQAFNKWIKAAFPGIAYDAINHVWSVKTAKEQWEKSVERLNDRCQFADDGGLVFTVTAAERQTVRDGWHKVSKAE